MRVVSGRRVCQVRQRGEALKGRRSLTVTDGGRMEGRCKPLICVPVDLRVLAQYGMDLKTRYYMYS